MILNGKEIRVVLGAITVFQHIPLSRTAKRRLSESEENCLSALFDELMTSIENEYQKFENKNTDNNIDVAKRLSTSLNVSFSNIEVQLIQEANKVCIDESEARNDNSINDYFNGDQYGINIHDFKNLYKRIREAKAERPRRD